MIVSVFSQIATDLATRLAAAGLPPLADGAVLLGPENTYPVAQSASPRIVFVPLGGSMSKRPPATPSFTDQTDYKASITQPWIWTDVQNWRVDVFGLSYDTNGNPSPDLTQNWDWTAAMFYVVIQSLHALLEGTWKPIRYEWIDSKPGSTKYSAFGRGISFWFDLWVPVLLINLPTPSSLAKPGLPLVPSSTDGTVVIGFSGGSGGDSITIAIPTIP